MTVQNLNLEWANHNSIRRYPLADSSHALDGTGTFTIPNDFLIELDLPVHAANNVDPGRFFIKQIDAYPVAYVITVGYTTTSGSEVIDVATALVPAAAFTANKKYITFALTGIGNFADSVGKVVIGTLESINRQPPGSWTFNLTSTRLDPDAVRPILRGVTSITVVNGSQRSAKIYGDITFVAGTNCRIGTFDEEGQDPVITFNYIRGEGTVEDCVCYGDAAPTQPITTINGVTGDLHNNVSLLGTDCLVFTPIVGGLQVTNTCASPCCGPTELGPMMSDLEKLKSRSELVKLVVDQMQVSVNTFSSVVLGSRLGDANCRTS